MPNNNRVMRRPLRRHPGQAPAPAGVPTAEGEGERGAARGRLFLGAGI